MPLAELDILALPTEDLALSWTIPEGDDALDLTGASLTLTVRPDYVSPVELVVLSSGNGLLWIDDDPKSGTFGLDVPQATVAEWPTGAFVCTLVDTDPAGPREIARGRFAVGGGRTIAFEPAALGAALRLAARSDADLGMPLEIRDRNVPVDLTGWTLALKLRAADDRREVLHSVVVTPALARLGRLRLALSAAVLALLPLETAWTLTGVRGSETRLFLSGSLTVDPRIWRDGFALPVSLAGSTLVDLRVRRSEDMLRRWQLSDRDGRPVDLAAYSARLVVRPDFDDPALIASYEIGSGLIDRGDGVIELNRSNALVGALPIGLWRYLLIVNGPTGQTEIARGGFEVIAGNISTDPHTLLVEDGIPRLQLRESVTGPRLEAKQSADFRFALRIMDGSLPRDLTGSSVRLIVRPDFGSREILTYFESGAQLTLAEGGIISGAVAQATVAALPAGAYRYLLIVNGPGGLFEPARGEFIVEPGNSSVASWPVPVGDAIPRLDYNETAGFGLTARQTAILRKTFRIMDGSLPHDLSGSSVRLIILPSYDWTGSPIQRFDTDSSGVYITDGPAGLLALSINQDAFAALPAGSWVFLLILNSTDGLHELARGPFDILPGIL